jgi:mRNA interferase MazF
MALWRHPEIGTIVICDFHGFIKPEMVKRRLAVIVSPRFRKRYGLCTIVPMSTTPPDPIMPYHYELKIDEPFPPPYDSPIQWVKGDMFATVSFKRLSLPCKGKNRSGKREYIVKIIEDVDLRNIRACLLHALDFSHLTKHL